MAVEWATTEDLMSRVMARLRPADVVLDVGCGIRPQPYIKPKLLVCVDAHREYLEVIRDTMRNTRTVVVQGAVPDVLRLMPDGSVDTVFMLDFVEHIEKETGLAAVAEAERIARSQVVVFTPIGFMPQGDEGGNGDEDGWGLHGAEWQRHRSGWEVDDFGDGWDVIGCEGYHTTNGAGEPFDEPFGAMWAIRTKDRPKGQAADADLGSVQGIDVIEASIRTRDENLFSRDLEARRNYDALKVEAEELRTRTGAMTGEIEGLRAQIAELNARARDLEQQRDRMAGSVVIKTLKAVRRLGGRAPSGGGGS